MSGVIYFIVLLLILFVGYKLLVKVNFNLDGWEIAVFQLSFLFIFQIGKYYNYYMFDFISKEGMILFIVLLYYYLLKTIKTQKYTNLGILGLYFITFIIDFFSIGFVRFAGLEVFAYYGGYIVGCIIIFLYILLMNFISFIIKKRKKTALVSLKKNEISSNSNFMLIISILIIFLPLIYAYIGNKLYDYFDNKRIAKAQGVAVNYLREEYGIDNVIIKEVEESGGCPLFGGCSPYTYDITLNLDYDDVVVEVNKGTYEIENEDEIENDFKFIYLSKLMDKKVNDYKELEDALENRLENNINEKIKSYNVKVNTQILFDRDKFAKISYSESSALKYLMELEKCYKLADISAVIYQEFNSNELDEFTSYIIDLYKLTKTIFEEYNHEGELTGFYFEFNSINPFYSNSSNTLVYIDGVCISDKRGYIRENGGVYYIYIDTSPIEIKK